MFFFLKKFSRCKKPNISSTLGHQLTMARHAQGWSVSDAAQKAHLDEALILGLEADNFFNNLGYERLVAVRYAQSLGLTLSEISSALPPLPSLQPAGSTFLKKLSEVSSPRRPSAILQRQTYSVSVLMTSLLKILVILSILTLLLYAWSFIRHLSRVIF